MAGGWQAVRDGGLELVQHTPVDARKSAACWAILKSNDIVYVVFQGWQKSIDWIINSDGTPISNGDTGNITVHGGIWNALHRYGIMPVDRIKAELTALAKEKERMIVLSGHSLGGGNAELCGLELLKEDFPVSAIIAHGAPQVIQPDPSNLL